MNISFKVNLILLLYFLLCIDGQPNIIVQQDYQSQTIKVICDVNGTFSILGSAIYIPSQTIYITNTEIEIGFADLNDEGGFIYITDGTSVGTSNSVYIYPPKYITNTIQNGNLMTINFNFNINDHSSIYNSLPNNNNGTMYNQQCNFLSSYGDYFDLSPLILPNSTKSPYHIHQEPSNDFYFNLCGKIGNAIDYNISVPTQSIYSNYSGTYIVGLAYQTNYTISSAYRISLFYGDGDEIRTGNFSIGCNILSTLNYKNFIPTSSSYTLSLESKYACSSKVISNFQIVNSTSIQYNISSNNFQSVILNSNLNFKFKIPIDPIISSFLFISDSRTVILKGYFDDSIYYKFQFGDIYLNPITFNSTVISLNLFGFSQTSYLKIYYRSNQAPQQYLISGNKLTFTLDQDYQNRVIIVSTDLAGDYLIKGTGILLNSSSPNPVLNNQITIPFSRISPNGGTIYISVDGINSDSQFIYPENYISGIEQNGNNVTINFNFNINLYGPPINNQIPPLFNRGIINNDQCKFISNSSDFFDLLPLKLSETSKTPYTTSTFSGIPTIYYFNVCGRIGNSIDYGIYTSVQSLQIYAGIPNIVGIPSNNSYEIVNPTKITLDYFSSPRTGVFNFICNYSSSYLNFGNFSEDPSYQYNFEIMTKCACSSKLITNYQTINNTAIQFTALPNNIPTKLINMDLNLYIDLPIVPIITANSFNNDTRLFTLQGVFDIVGNYEFLFGGNTLLEPWQFTTNTIILDFSKNGEGDLIVKYRSESYMETFSIPGFPPPFSFSLTQDYQLQSIQLSTQDTGNFRIQGSALNTQVVYSLTKFLPTSIPFSQLASNGGTIYISQADLQSVQQVVYPPELISNFTQLVDICLIVFSYNIDNYPIIDFNGAIFERIDSTTVMYSIIENQFKNQLKNDDLNIIVDLPIEPIIYSTDFDEKTRVFTSNGAFSSIASNYKFLIFNIQYGFDTSALNISMDSSVIVIDFSPIYIKTNLTISYFNTPYSENFKIQGTKITFKHWITNYGLVLQTHFDGNFSIEGNVLSIQYPNNLTKDINETIPFRYINSKGGNIYIIDHNFGLKSDNVNIYAQDLESYFIGNSSSSIEENNGEKDKKLKLTVGLVIGIFVLILIISVSIFYWILKKRISTSNYICLQTKNQETIVIEDNIEHNHNS